MQKETIPQMLVDIGKLEVYLWEEWGVRWKWEEGSKLLMSFKIVQQCKCMTCLKINKCKKRKKFGEMLLGKRTAKFNGMNFSF